MPAARPIYDWSGFYLGLNGGGAQSHNCWNMNGYNVPVFSPSGKPTFIGISGATNIAEGCSTSTGAVFGGQVGYRYQVNSFVFGLEAQGDWANLSSSFNSAAFTGINTALSKLPGRLAGGASLVNTSKVDAIGMFTGQVGYSFGPLLWYVKGGAAVTDTKYSGVANLNVGTLLTVNATDAASAVRFGEVVGTGVEWMFAPGWSIGAEYNHLFMGSQNVGFAYTGSSVTAKGLTSVNAAGIPSRNVSINGDLDMATFRLNYSFGH
jgi:outer membrane immunogenic protein